MTMTIQRFKDREAVLLVNQLSKLPGISDLSTKTSWPGNACTAHLQSPLLQKLQLIHQSLGKALLAWDNCQKRPLKSETNLNIAHLLKHLEPKVGARESRILRTAETPTTTTTTATTTTTRTRTRTRTTTTTTTTTTTVRAHPCEAIFARKKGHRFWDLESG